MNHPLSRIFIESSAGQKCQKGAEISILFQRFGTLRSIHLNALLKFHYHIMFYIQGGIGHPVGVQQLRNSVVGEPLISTTKIRI
jgi:hypothetical protein